MNNPYQPQDSNNDMSKDMSQGMSQENPENLPALVGDYTSPYASSESKIPAKLKKFAGSKNIAEELTNEELAMVGMRVAVGYQEDKQTQRLWLSNVEDAQRLAKLIKEPKNTPLPQSANIKYPLITNACYQFAARTYPELIQDGKVVKCEVIGKDLDGSLTEQANRISTHMSYQLLVPDNEWEASMDRLLVVLPNVGFLVKKTYYDAIRKKNTSVLCNYKDIVLRNASDIQTLDDLRRITHDLYYHVNDLIEQAREGCFREDVVEEIVNRMSTNPTDSAVKLQEQHRFLDLDEDGYEEPYIVTIEEGTNKVLRIVARYTEEDIRVNDKGEVCCINPIQCFTDFHFLPASDGSFMSVGFGTLMLHLNETVNTILNQLIDAGTLANMQGGFIDSRLKIMGGQMYQDPGQWNRVKGVIGQTLKDGVLPIQYKEPSNVLFQLLGMLIQTSKDLSSSTEVMEGSAAPQNVPATTILALVEQGMKVFNSIQRRLYRSLKGEYQKLFRLNQIYLDPTEEAKIVGDGVVISQDDYKNSSVRVVPIADPNLSSDAQRMAKVQFLMNLMNQPATSQYMNIPECINRAFIAVNMPNPTPLIKNAPPAPDPKMLQVQAHAQQKQAEVQIKGRAQDLKEKEFAAKLAKMEAEIQQLQAKSVQLVSQASKDQKQGDLQALGLHIDAMKAQVSSVAQAHKQMTDSNIAHKEMALKQQELDQTHQREVSGMQQQQAQHEDNLNAQENRDNGVEQPPSNPGDAQAS